MSDISKLPKWAQKHISNIEREREVAVIELNKYVDSQTKSKIYIDDFVCLGEEKGPTLKTRYINGTHRVTFDHAGIELNVSIAHEGCINLTFNSLRHGTVGIVPRVTNAIELRTKDNM